MRHGDDEVGVTRDVLNKSVDPELDITTGLILSREELEERHSRDVVIDVCALRHFHRELGVK